MRAKIFLSRITREVSLLSRIDQQAAIIVKHAAWEGTETQGARRAATTGQGTPQKLPGRNDISVET